ncbi:MAG: DSD1 family PLP-dependent enzyme, partial [Gemmatimonadetes bacterium]|nr:DSD1 family PLP-dependent enzyme [Gemmatimonadota bacterium]
LDRLNLEHGVLLLEGDARDMPVGTRLRVLPMCADTTVNLHSHYFCVRKGMLESVVEVAGRGMFR